MAGTFPESIALRVDPRTRRSGDGRSILGGAPLRLLRFSAAGAAAADRVLAADRGPRSPTEVAVARRLVDAGMAHPRPSEVPDLSVSLVVPVRDHAEDLGRLLDADPVPGATEVVVVDDGSADAGGLARAVEHRAAVLRHARSRGPGAARNTGWSSTSAELTVFLDADVVPTAGWLGPLLAHFSDPAVGIVAPRVRSRDVTGTVRERYETVGSPLDLGTEETRVTPRGRVSYVPTAALVCRRTVLEELGGFEESMRFGEDVDLVWRAVEAGWGVRYEPRSEVTHRPRPSWGALVRQRVAYGSTAAALDQRHPGAVAPVECNAWSLLAWVLAVCGGRTGMATGALTAAGSTAALVPKLRGRLDHPVRDAVVLAGGGTLRTGVWLGRAVWRAWLPLAVVGSLRSRRIRRATVAAAIVPAVLDGRDRGRPIDPIRWSVLHALDDAAYCAGVWQGVWQRRSVRCLAPRLSGIPGVTDRSGPRPR